MSFLSQPATLQTILGADRQFGPITVDVIINENTSDNLVITKQPVQTGAPITDHAYKEPTVLQMKMRFSPELFNSLYQIYQELLVLQFPPVPFDVTTPKRIYRNMLIASLGCTTDKYTENVLAIDITFQQIILVSIAPTSVVPIKQQAKPTRTQGKQNTGQKSAFKQIFGG